MLPIFGMIVILVCFPFQENCRKAFDVASPF